MKPLEQELQLQSYVDEELSPAEAREVERLLASDAHARATVEELRLVRDCMAVGELERVLPEGREFYWSKIERHLRVEPARTRSWRGFFTAALRPKFLLPIAGVAALLLILLAPLNPTDDPVDRYLTFHEIETSVSDADVISFVSESSGMTVVWVASGR